MILFFAFTRCNAGSDYDIAGTYTRESAGEYSRAWDTLTIKDYNPTHGIYQIHRRTGFVRYKDGVALPKEWRYEKMIAGYDATREQLSDQKTGRLFSFKDGEVLFGTAVYKKISNK